MRIPERVSLFVSNSLEELVYPNRRVDGESFAVQGFEFDGSSAGLDYSPEAGDTHGWDVVPIGVVEIMTISVLGGDGTRSNQRGCR
jgi:hypothetical protein